MKFADSEEILTGTEKSVNFKKYILKLLRRWPYIVTFFILSVAVGYTINRYATPVYEVKARITTRKFSDKPSSPVPGLVDANFFLSGLTEVYEEIPILKSPNRIEAAIEKLDFRVTYFAKGWIKNDIESVHGYGFDVEIDSIKGPSAPYGVDIFVNHLSEKEFELEIQQPEWHALVADKKFRFGTPFSIGDADIRIINTNGKTAERLKYYFVLNRTSDLVNQYRSRLNIDWAMRGSAMLDLTIRSETPEKDLKFLRAYYEVVERIGLEEKNKTLDNTIQFIDTQMAIVSDSLSYYQAIIDDMKLDNRSLNLGSDNIYNQLNELEAKKAEIVMNERYLDYLTNYFRTKSDEEVFAPSLMGLNIPLLETWVNQYITQKLQEKYQRTEENAYNPLVNREDSLKRRLERGIFESIKSVREVNHGKLAEVNKQASMVYASVKDVQTDFRKLSKYERMYQLNQTLFDLFLKRKTEASISKASATSDYKIIDAPYYSRKPLKPDEEMNLMLAAAIGLIVPVGFFLIKDITNTRIMDKDDLQSRTQMPMLGNVAHSDYSTNLVVRDYPRSIVSESFRSVRANLKYIVSGLHTKCHTFLITSSVGGEGKTFCSLNLACTLAASKKKTILIAADLRKPQLANYMERLKSQKGLSEYLAGLASIEEILINGENIMPDVIDAGNIPPNPSELLGSERMADIIAYLKDRYEYVIIDTPPIGLVSDAMELFKYADYNILIVRQAVTHKAALGMIDELYVDGKLRNFGVLFNDIEFRKRSSYYGGYLYGMGYGGYGYGYYEEDKKNKNA
jgi:capsular exopolysaccharide synthesis family protein